MEKKISVFLFTLSILIFFMGAPDTGKGNADYVGSETCKGCHEDTYKGFLKSVHGKKAISGSPVNREGCESCHGPGGQHAEKDEKKGTILAFARMLPAKERSSRCLTCHEESKGSAFWDISRHKSSDISCDQCHSIHKGTGKSLKGREPELCFTCHKDIRAQANKQSHHPVREGRIKCLNCHDPHGGLGPKMVRADSVNELCYKCHAEKRGPYAFEHPPVSENCLLCHEVHGSNHNSLLTWRVPLLCQSCHSVEGTHPTRPYTNLHSFSGSATAGKNRFFGRSCLNCHGNIHGSNHPTEEGRTFVR